MAITIGIVGWPEDEQVAYMTDVLRHLGAEVLHIDTRRRNFQQGWRWDRDGIFAPDGRNLESLGALWASAYAISLPGAPSHLLEGPPLREWQQAYAADWARYGFSKSIQKALEEQGIPCINPMAGFWLHNAKAQAMRLLRDAGIRVPRTLVTDSAAAVLDFASHVPEVVYKPAGGGGTCQKLQPEDLQPARLELLRRAPCLFQELIPGDNLRIFVVGEDVVSTTIIHSDSLDYRGHERGVERAWVPPEVGRDAVRAARLCGLVYSGIDVRRTPEGQHVFLDVNPAPMFVTFEKFSGDPISERLGRHLIQAAAQRGAVR